MAAPGTPEGVYPFMARPDRAHGYLPGIPLLTQIHVVQYVFEDVAKDPADCALLLDALGLDPVILAECKEQLELDAQETQLAYWLHREECWYTGDPGDGCHEHIRLYETWQEALAALGIREEEE